MNIFATQNLMSLHIFCLKNKAFTPTILRLVILGCVVILNFPLIASTESQLATQSEFNTQAEFNTQDFKLDIPTDLERVENSSALLVLRHRTLGFPSFNAIAISGLWPHSDVGVENQGAKIVDQYRLVGLKDAQLLSAKSIKINDLPALMAEISYKDAISTNHLLSRVWVVQLKDRHLIFTAVFKSPLKASDSELIAGLLNSIQIKPLMAPSQVQEGWDFEGNLILIGLVAIIFIAGFSFIKLRETKS